MALLTSEVYRIKAELGHNVLSVSAEPYIGVAAIFDAVISAYMTAGASTTSATAVTAASTPTAVTLTLTSATGFTSGDRVFIDVDDLQESATIRSLSGTSMGVILRLGHSDTYPVVVDGGEGVIRELLKNIRAVKSELGDTFGTGAVRKVDEIEFWQAGQSTAFGNLSDQLRYYRRELSQVLCNGQALNMWERSRAASQRLAVY